MAVRHVLQCPTHGDFELRRPMAEGGTPAPCPSCQISCKQVVRFNPQTQMHMPNKFHTNFGTTGFKTNYGGGDWENHVSAYHKWDSDFAGPSPLADAPPEMR